MFTSILRPFTLVVAVFASFILVNDAVSQTSDLRGLWVGQVSLKYVNEVSVPYDGNTPKAPNPNIPTPTFDAANLRLILHVNGAGQVSLLKDVAILARKEGVQTSENDLALVTDPRLYGEFPPQPAIRIASAVFDFGDRRATEAVNEVVDTVVEKVWDSVKDLDLADLAAVADRDAAESAAFANATDDTSLDAAPAIIAQANASADFDFFLKTYLPVAVVDSIALDLSLAASDTASPRQNALELENGSFYGDSRGVEVLDAIDGGVSALPGSASDDEKKKTARNIVSSYADLTNQYQRFLAGESFGDMIASSSVAAAESARVITPGAIEDYSGLEGDSPTMVTSTAHGLTTGDVIIISGDTITETGSSELVYRGKHVVTVDGDPDGFSIDVPFVEDSAIESRGAWVALAPVLSAANGSVAANNARAEALRIQVASYNDTRSVDSIDLILDAIAIGACEKAVETDGIDVEVRTTAIVESAEAAGRDALTSEVARYALPDGAPSEAYGDFVGSETFQESGETAAEAAAAAAVFEIANNLLSNQISVKAKSTAAAIGALRVAYSAAARVAQNALPMKDGGGGGFGPGNGDPRFTLELAEAGETPGASALDVQVLLPASHPTNPFRHRRHPDHTVGFDIERSISLDFDDSESSPNPRAGYGVDRLTGVYREEVRGLHKPLGTQPKDNPIGLKVEGTFELNRISLIDTLNAR